MGPCTAFEFKAARGVQLQLSVVLSLSFFVCHSAAEHIFIETGDAFVEVVQDFAKAGGDVHMELGTASPISVANASWNPKELDEGFKSGSLTMRAASNGTGGPFQGLALIDTAMRSGLSGTLPYTMGSNIQWQDVILINLCARMLPFKPPDIWIIGHDNLYILARGRELQNYERRNTTVYVTNGDFLGLLTWLVLDSMPFQAIKERWTDFALQLAPKTDAEVSFVDEFSMVLKKRRAAGGLDRNVTIRTTNNPNDPFGLRLPELGGDLMQHRFCSPDGTATGPPLSRAAVFEANFTIGPIWIISGSKQLVDRLADVSEWGINPLRLEGKWLPTAVVVFVGNASFALSSSGVANHTLLRSDTLLHGPLSPFRPTLDFANRKGVIRMGSQADLFIKDLDLSGLKSEASEGTGDAHKDTTLRLVGIDRQDRQIEVAQVTLHVAKQDFIVLLSAAHRGERWQSGASSTAYLMKSVSVFKPAEFSRSSLTLSEYSGWGVNGIDVQFVPSSPLLDSDILLDQDSPASSNDNAVALGVGIGVGVGGSLLFIGTVIALAVLLKRRKGQGSTAAAAPYPAEEIKSVIKNEEGENGSAASRPRTSDRSSESGGSLPQNIAKAPLSAKGSLALGQPLSEICIESGSAPIQKMKEDQSKEDPNALVRREAGDILKVGGDQSLVLDCILGKGACGTVYKGTWKGLDVAVKTVLFTEHSSTSNLPQQASAILEAAVSASMSHPNVVSTYHYDIKPIRANPDGLQIDAMTGMNDWKLFLVQEYCHCTLNYGMACGLLHKGEKPVMSRVLHLLLEVASGTLYLHDRQIIHGDLKPDNVLLKADSSSQMGLTAKITDFGLSTNLGPHATHASNFSGGTPYYAPPEVTMTGRTSKASDAFSFGVIMAELYSRTPPWVKVNGIFSANPDFPNFPPGAPPPFMNLACRCLEVELSKRPKFEEIVSSLQGMLRELN